MLHTDPSSPVDSAARHVAKAWFPYNKAVLEKIRSSYTSNSYHEQLELVVRDLKTDSSLYLLCLKKLIHLLKENGATSVEFSPDVIFRTAGYENLRLIIHSDFENDTLHRLETSSDIQNARVREAMVSASTTEVLAKKSSLDSELGFGSALLRQLGHTLIAWNYPHVYSRALSSLGKNHNDLDLEIQTILGFSPSMLAISVAKDWGVLDSDLARLLDSPEQKEEDLSPLTAIKKLCKIGEALARANDPENYPSALADWKSAQRDIVELVGSDGLALIQQHIEANLIEYHRRAPQFFSVKVVDNLESKIANSNFAKALLEENKYVSHCPPLLQLQIKELYLSFVPNDVSRETIVRLTNEIIPIAGFSNGCVYIFEPANMSLVPILKIGTPLPQRTKPIKLTGINLDANPVVTAFRCNTPIKQVESFDADRTQITTLSGSLGGEQKAGVLYLEISPKLLSKQKADPDLYFKAIRQCLNHCLGLR